MPSPTETHDTILAELDVLTRRIKEGRTTDDLRQLLNLMNDLSQRLPDDTLVEAKYHFLRGVVYIKGAVVHGNWISSAGESLYYALDILERANGLARELLEHSPTKSLVEFQQDCVYEAMVAVTTLQAWGRHVPKEARPNVACLPSTLQQRIANHFDHGHPLRSRYV